MPTSKQLTRANERVSAKLSTYDPNVALRICELIAEGQTLTDIVAMDGIPSRPTIYRWLTAFPEFHDAYERARTLSAQSFEEEALLMARILKDKNDFTGTKVQAYNIAMQQLRWSAARRDSNRYGQKQAMNVTVPIQINTSLNLGQDGRPAEGAKASVYTLEAEVIADTQDEPEETGDFLDNLPDVSDTGQVAFGVPEKQRHGLASRKGGRPKGTFKGHKTAEQTQMTKLAYARRAKNAALKAEKAKTDDGTSNS